MLVYQRVNHHKIPSNPMKLSFPIIHLRSRLAASTTSVPHAIERIGLALFGDFLRILPHDMPRRGNRNGVERWEICGENGEKKGNKENIDENRGKLEGK
jgi:hypothetical protein